jgi:DNA-binding transcriptional regulator LsrR (DeoR family)
MKDKQQRDIEQQLRERINRLVDEAIAEAKTDKPLRLRDIEAIALAVRAKVAQEVAQALVQQQGGGAVPGPTCAQCGREMHSKGRKKRRVVSRSGGVDWERPYYYCETCRRGFFSPRMKRLG